MRTPRVVVLALTLVALHPARTALADAGAAAAAKPVDVMTVNGVQVPVPASVPDLTSPPRPGAPPRAILAPGDLAATPGAAPPARARRVSPGAARVGPPPGSVPALLGPIPRPEWGAAAVPAEPKPADIVTIGEPTGIDTPPAAPATTPSGQAPAAAKTQRDLRTSAPRAATAPPPSPVKAEVKR